MSNGRIKGPSVPPVRPHAEPLDDIILGDEDETIAATAPQPAEPQRASTRPRAEEQPIPLSEGSRKSQRQKLLRIPDDEISRPQIEDDSQRKIRHAGFDPESTVKMSALELDSSPLPMDEDSWTPIAPLTSEHTRAAAAAADPTLTAPHYDSLQESRDEMPTPPPTSEEIPVALEDPMSAEKIEVAEPSSPIDLLTRAEEEAEAAAEAEFERLHIRKPVDDQSRMIALGDIDRGDDIDRRPTDPPPPGRRTEPPAPARATDPPPARTTDPPPAMRDQLRTQIDSGELGIDVSFQSSPSFEISPDGTGPMPVAGAVPLDIAGDRIVSRQVSIGDETELAADDLQAVDSQPARALQAAQPVAHPSQAPQPPPPPPMRAKTQSTPSIPPGTQAPVAAASSPGGVPTHASQPQPPPVPPMRPRTQSTPSVPPGTQAPLAAGAPSPIGAAHPQPPPVPPMRAKTQSTPSVPPGTQAPAAGSAPSPIGAKPPPPKAKPMLLPLADGIAPPPMQDTSQRKKVRPWWEELFNDDFIRAMEKLTDAQVKREADFIEDSLGVAKGAMVLDLACGTGRHAIELSTRGYSVVGYDLSLAMLARAQDESDDRGVTLNFVQGDMREMTFDEMFDGIYSWNTSFGFFEEEKNAHVVSKVHKALKKGGQFLLDVVNRDYVARQSPSLVWFEGEGCICMDEMQVDWITSRMKIKRTMMIEDGRSREIEFSMRVYSLHELGKLLHDAGFRVAEVSGRTATPGVFFGSDSPRTIILAEKR